MAAAVVQYLSGLYCGGTSTATGIPIVLYGKEGEDYLRFKVTNTTAAQTRIGSFFALTAASITAGDYAADGASGIWLVDDSKYNKSVLQNNNSGGEVTYALTFSAAAIIEVITPVKPIVVNVEAAASETAYPGTAMECTAAGLCKIFANGPVIGYSLTDSDNGTGTKRIALKWNPLGIGLTS